MYHYSKPRNNPRTSVNPKENIVYGPQGQGLGLQASGSAINERLQRQHSEVKVAQNVGTTRAPQDLLNNNSLIKRISQSAEMTRDRVVFAESPSAPGVPIVYRTPEERSANPDRLNLDRRKLEICPILEGEDQLRLLNYQHNLISKIQHLSSFKRLIFLDLYDNQIEEISGLSALKSLRVLMLGKNRIKKIENLEPLMKLDVLDLHGNMINKIEKLRHLVELRVLNLAGNNISLVDSLMGMDALAELNLRRNKITHVADIDNLPSLQRLFLSFNEITCFEDISCLAESTSLSEVSLDGNPFAQDASYKQTVLRHMHQLRQLDMKRVAEEERRIAAVMARKEEEKKRESNKAAQLKEKRRLAIKNAQRQWEVMQGSIIGKTGALGRMPELYANHIGTYPSSEITPPSRLGSGSGESPQPNNTHYPPDEEELESLTSQRSELITGRSSRPTSAKSSHSDLPPPHPWKHERPMSDTTPNMGNQASQSNSSSSLSTSRSGKNLCHLAELEGDTLNLYGTGSLEALDRNWGIQAAGAVTSVIFKFIDFDEIVKHLHKIRARFPSVVSLTFNSTNISCLRQLNALASVRRLDNLVITENGNPITQFTLWKIYTLFRLAHFSIRKINDVEVTASDIVSAEKLFGTLAHITTSQLPQSRLLALLGKKQMQALTEKGKKSPDDYQKLSERSTVESVGRAGLTYNSEPSSSKTQEKKTKQQFSMNYIKDLTTQAIMTDKKKQTLQKVWPQIFYDLVQNAVIDMADPGSYMKRCMEQLEKG
ncbi:unnamed protein product [Owenia fusiformis]|uniref:Leucine-rich repeat-containing protein 49 n=1 Tax=Owenia fusiformis TaxID=6347 RepID=A0A8S4Q0N6_OWEFU|nr:unnamed protein product [Owenia fusiformis]